MENTKTIIQTQDMGDVWHTFKTHNPEVITCAKAMSNDVNKAKTIIYLHELEFFALAILADKTHKIKTREHETV